MNRAMSLTVVMTMLAALGVHAQDSQSPTAAQPTPATPTLENGDRVDLTLHQTLQSAKAGPGQTLDVSVLGGHVCATVEKVEHKSFFGKCGAVTLSASVQVQGKEVPFRAVLDGQGFEHGWCQFIPYVPILPGKETTTQNGTKIPAIMSTDRSGFITFEITSHPTGAAIELDGTPKGDTPSCIAVRHDRGVVVKVKISKPGYKPWELNEPTTSDNSKIVVDLVQQSQSAESELKPAEAQSTAKPQQ